MCTYSFPHSVSGETFHTTPSKITIGEIVANGAVLEFALRKPDKREQTFSDMFVAYLLTRNIRYEEDLVDQLFNSSEKRLARILLLLAHFGKEGKHRDRDPQNDSGGPSRNGGHNAVEDQFFPEQVQEIGIHRL